MEKINIFWFRRDLRLEDNTGLHHALRSGRKVLPLFIFDTDILQKFTSGKDRRVDYIQQVLEKMASELKKYNSSLFTFSGTPVEVFGELSGTYEIDTVFCNRDYEPGAIRRDREVSELLEQQDIRFLDYKDQVIFDKGDILKNDGQPYTVYTPYSRRW